MCIKYSYLKAHEITLQTVKERGVDFFTEVNLDIHRLKMVPGPMTLDRVHDFSDATCLRWE